MHICSRHAVADRLFGYMLSCVPSWSASPLRSPQPERVQLNPKPWVLPPLSNSWIIIIVGLCIALNRTPNIDCYWGGDTQPKPYPSNRIPSRFVPAFAAFWDCWSSPGSGRNLLNPNLVVWGLRFRGAAQFSRNESARWRGSKNL